MEPITTKADYHLRNRPTITGKQFSRLRKLEKLQFFFLQSLHFFLQVHKINVIVIVIRGIESFISANQFQYH